jgi:Cdc6-like AAA superfamily ATPase
VPVEHKVSTVQITSESIKSNLHAARMKEWLSPPDPSTNANMARKVRHEGSGNWLLQSTVFQTWQAGSLRHLWLRGLAGCGKTVLSAAVLDHLAAQNAQRSSNIILSFFFDFSDKEKQTVEGMLRSLAYQLYSDGDERSRQCLDKLFEQQSNGLKQPSSANLGVTICSMLAAQEGNIYILLDALDEATERRTLLEWIANVYRAPGLGHVRLIYTERPESKFLQDLPRTIGQGACLTLDKEAINADICSYVEAKLRDKPLNTRIFLRTYRARFEAKLEMEQMECKLFT